MDVIELWWLSLALAAVVVLVVAVLLGLIIAAAKSINGHVAGIWTVGKQIAGNTVSIWLLDKTSRQLESLQQGARDLDGTVGGMSETLQAISRSADRGGDGG